MKVTTNTPRPRVAARSRRTVATSVGIWMLRVGIVALLAWFAFLLYLGAALQNWVDHAEFSQPYSSVRPARDQVLGWYTALATVLALVVLALRRSLLLIVMLQALLYVGALATGLAVAVWISSPTEQPILFVVPILAGVVLIAYWVLMAQSGRQSPR
jgi:hypothetical protein